MVRHLDTLGALCLIAEGRVVPPAKYTALRRLGLISVRGNGAKSLPQISDAVRDLLSKEGRHA